MSFARRGSRDELSTVGTIVEGMGKHIRLRFTVWLLELALRVVGPLGTAPLAYSRAAAELERLESQLVDWCAWLRELQREAARLEERAP